MYKRDYDHYFLNECNKQTNKPSISLLFNCQVLDLL